MEGHLRSTGRARAWRQGLAGILLSGPIFVFAQTPGTPPLEAYRTNTTYGRFLCQATLLAATSAADLAAQGGDPGDDASKRDWRACIRKQTAEALGYLKAVTAKTKKPALREALKNHYAAWSAAMRGLEPSLSERKIDYSRRQAALEDKINEAWAKVEAEE